jgi:fructose-1-phosphate kinase PfkB-like protein
MAALGTYQVLLVKPNKHFLQELTQASSSAEATEKIKAMYPECQHLETKTKVMSEGEANKAAAAKEAAALKQDKIAREKVKEAQKKRDARKKKK